MKFTDCLDLLNDYGEKEREFSIIIASRWPTEGEREEVRQAKIKMLQAIHKLFKEVEKKQQLPSRPLNDLFQTEKDYYLIDSGRLI